MISVEAEYRGYKIEWVDFRRLFEIKEDGETVRQDMRTVEECEKWIDSRLKAKFKRVNVFHRGWRSEYSKGVATSLIEERGGCSVWFTNTKKQRSREGISSIYIDNESNAKLMADIFQRKSQIKVLDTEIETLAKQLENLTTEMMVIKEGK